jgi:hypothetical protein
VDDPRVIDVDPVRPGQDDPPGAAAPGGAPLPPPAGIEWTPTRVAWVVVAAAVVGMLLGQILFRPDPDLQLLDAQEELRERDETIAELQGRVAVLEAELRQASPDALERARLEEEMARREAQVAQREAAVTQREEEIKGLWTLPRISIPDVEAVERFFGRLSNWFSQLVGGDSTVDDATGSTADPALRDATRDRSGDDSAFRDATRDGSADSALRDATRGGSAGAP